MNARTYLAIAIVLALTAGAAQAQIRITEWEYNGAGSSTAGEFVELINVGNSAIDMTGWSFDDSSRAAGSFSIGAFGMVQPKEIVVIAESTAADFRAKWNLLPASVKVIGGNNQNLSRADEINIYDNVSSLVDRLTFDDQTIAGSIRTNGISGNPKTVAALGAKDVLQWKLSAAGDGYGSYLSTEGNLGNPGVFSLVPEPGALVLSLLGLSGFGIRRRNR